jgi:hypothetical protein
MWLADNADADVEVSKWQESHPSLAVSHVEIDPTTLPTSRRWREAWRLRNGVVGVDLPSARLVRKQELLAERDKRLQLISPQVDEAEDSGNTAVATALRLRRISLRALDATLDADLAAVLDLTTLAGFVPTILQTPD